MAEKKSIDVGAAKEAVDPIAADATKVIVDPTVADVVDGADEALLAPEVTLVVMRRDYDETLGGPTTADVHTDEVEHWQSVGWLIVAEPAVNEPLN